MKYHQSGQSDQGNKQPLTLNILGWGGDLYYGGKSGETTFKVILYSKRKEGKSLKKNNDNNNCQVFPCCYMGEFFFYKPWCHLFFAVPF